MRSFFQDRGLGLVTVILIMFVISLAQGGISYTMAYGSLQYLLPSNSSLLATGLVIFRFVLIAGLAVLWILKRKQTLFRLIIVGNALFTVALLSHTITLVTVLFGSASEAVRTLMLDVVLMAVSNILIFSIWYWIVDPPGVEENPRIDNKWDFLFPQRASGLPQYEDWVPRYTDYLFVAFTASFSFGPADTPPLTLRAKRLMILQAIISVVTLTAIAGSAIGLLSGGK